MNQRKHKLLRIVFHISRHYAWIVCLVALALTLAASYYVIDLPIHSSYLALLPQNDPLITEYREHEEYLAQNDYVALLLRLQNPDDLSTNERKKLLLDTAGIIAQELESNPEFTEITYLLQPSPKIPDQYLLLYSLTEEKLAQIQEDVSKARGTISADNISNLPSTALSDVYLQITNEIDQAIYHSGLATLTDPSDSKLDQQLTEISAINESVLNALDGISALPDVTVTVNNLDEIFSSTQGTTDREPTGFFSTDYSKLLMNVHPRFPSQRGIAYCTKIMESLQHELENLDLARSGMTVGVTGTYAFNASTNAVVNTDMRRTTVISSVGVLVIFFVAFGSVFYSIIAVIPLGISLILTMAWAKFSLGGLNLITTFLPALVLGLGIDYAVHLISRYAEERRKGKPLNPALLTAIVQKGRASLIAAVTTSLVFVCLLLSRSRAMFEMGAIASVGVLIAFVATLFLIPSLLTLSHYLFGPRRSETVANYADRLSSFFAFVSGKRQAIFSITIILTVFVSFQAADISFRFTSADLVPDVESQRVFDEVVRSFGASGTKIGNYFTFFASSEEELQTVVEKLGSSELVDTVESAHQLLPANLSDQRQVLSSLDINSYVNQLILLDKNLQDRSSIVTHTDTLLGQFSLLQYVATLNGFPELALSAANIQRELTTIRTKLTGIDLKQTNTELYRLTGALVDLKQDLEVVQGLPPIATLLGDILASLPAGIRSRYVTSDGQYIVYAKMNSALFKEGRLEEFNSFASSFSDSYFGMPKVGMALRGYMKNDFWLSTILAAILITIILRRTVGKWLLALLASTPLILGYIWMLGGMRLLEIDFNFINITISPLLIGIGVDNGIHILHRYLEEKKVNAINAIERSSAQTAVAIIVTSLTTMIVFGSLLLARTPGLRYLGISALLGLGFTLIFSLLFLPVALHASQREDYD